MCRRYSLEKNISNFKIVVNKSNSGGPSAGRNRGIKESRGKYIFFSDADDSIAKDCVQRLFTLAEKHNSDYTVALHRQIRGNSRSEVQGQVNHCGLDPSKLLDAFIVDAAYFLRYLNNYFKSTREYCLFEHCWGRLYRAEIIKENSLLFDEDFDQLEDVLFNAKYLSLSKEVLVLPDALYNHNLISSSSRLSLSSGEKKEIIKDLFLVSEHLNILRKKLIAATRPTQSLPVHINYFISSKIANYLVRMIIKINKSSPSEREQYFHLLEFFRDFYIREKLYEYVFVAADESWMLRTMFRYKLPLFLYPYASKLTLLVIWVSGFGSFIKRWLGKI